MGDLATGVNACVRAAGHGERRSRVLAQQAAEGILDGLLDCALARLAGPAVKLRAVIGQIETEPDLRAARGPRGDRSRRRRVRLRFR